MLTAPTDEPSTLPRVDMAPEDANNDSTAQSQPEGPALWNETKQGEGDIPLNELFKGKNELLLDDGTVEFEEKTVVEDVGEITFPDGGFRAWISVLNMFIGGLAGGGGQET